MGGFSEGAAVIAPGQLRLSIVLILTSITIHTNPILFGDEPLAETHLLLEKLLINLIEIINVRPAFALPC